jgi:pyridoxine 5-phosphate synthase
VYNIKIATLRNARGGNVPDLLKVATDIQNLADKELLYPRPDERHIRYQDARDLKQLSIPSLISR